MTFFRKIGDALARFMYGRNGMDQLNRALFILYFSIWILQMMAGGILKSKVLVTVFDVALWVLMVLIFFRMFSKNLYKRRGENQKWMNFWWRVKNDAQGARERRADTEHKYFTCKKCKTICRVPAGKGKLIITCPKCGEKIHGKS